MIALILMNFNKKNFNIFKSVILNKFVKKYEIIFKILEMFRTNFMSHSHGESRSH